MEFPKASKTSDYELPTIPVRCLAEGCSFLAAGPSQESNHRMVLAHMIFSEQDEAHKLVSDTWLQFVNDDFDPLFDEAQEEDDDGGELQKVQVWERWIFDECPLPACRVQLSDPCRERLYSHLFEQHEASDVEIFLGLRAIESRDSLVVERTPNKVAPTYENPGPEIVRVRASAEGDMKLNVYAPNERSVATRKRKAAKEFAFEEWAQTKRVKLRIESIRRNLKRKYVKEGNKIPVKGSPEYETWYQTIDQEARQLYQTEVGNGGSATELRVVESVDDLLAINNILKIKLDVYVSQGNSIPNRHLREFGGFWQHMHKLACDEYYGIKLRHCLSRQIDNLDLLAPGKNEMCVTDISQDRIHNSNGQDGNTENCCEDGAIQQLREIMQYLNAGHAVSEYGTEEHLKWLNSGDLTARLEHESESAALRQGGEDTKCQYMSVGYTIPDSGTPEHMKWLSAIDKMARKINEQDSEMPDLLMKQDAMCNDWQCNPQSPTIQQITEDRSMPTDNVETSTMEEYTTQQGMSINRTGLDRTKYQY
ncbi:hypothetical protein V1508DRAFT_414360 [Lipomyces doorenjongii]|uniref:uncharacterized protein n=1 Tax=Lipomyces doorenjongii TaxID=383834 RepID=UPI0034CF0063